MTNFVYCRSTDVNIIYYESVRTVRYKLSIFLVAPSEFKMSVAPDSKIIISTKIWNWKYLLGNRIDDREIIILRNEETKSKSIIFE